ncbi:MAG: isochorismatase family protein [Pseudomonadota bacterium]
MILERKSSQLLVIDVQAKLAPAVAGAEQVVANTRRLIAYADCMGVPVTATEQYPKGLGPTLDEVGGAVTSANGVILEKLAFSAWREPACRAHIAELATAGRRQIVIAGMEAHVCVLQAALDLQGAGFATSVVFDAIGSREPANVEVAVERLRSNGAQIVTQEMVAFEWLQRAGTEEFRKMLALLK